MEALVLHVWLCKYGSLSVLQVAEWLNGDRISTVQMVCRNLWEHWGYTVGHMILWEYYCYAGDCMNVEASVLYRWFCSSIGISAADMIAWICERITFIDICNNVETLVLYKWLYSHDRVRAAEMACVNVWEHYLYTAISMNVGELVLYKGLKRFVSISAVEMVVCICGAFLFYR